VVELWFGLVIYLGCPDGSSVLWWSCYLILLFMRVCVCLNLCVFWELFSTWETLPKNFPRF